MLLKNRDVGKWLDSNPITGRSEPGATTNHVLDGLEQMQI